MVKRVSCYAIYLALYVYRTIHDAMRNRLDIYPTDSFTTHISWKVNRMKPNRILRKLFPKPIGTPSWWSQGTEKYIFIDESESPSYILVCNMYEAFLLQLSWI